MNIYKKIFTIVYTFFDDKLTYISNIRWRSLVKVFGSNVIILSGTKIIAPHNLEIGDFTWIGHNCFIMAGANISIGKWCQIANNVIITSTNHKIDGNKYYGNVVVKEIFIGDNVWIGSNSIILPGIKIGDNSVIAAGAVVTKDVPSNKIYAGVPAKEIKDLTLIFKT